MFFLIILIIINLLILGLDNYFFKTISHILEFKNINSIELLNSLGYYNKSIFTNKIYIFILSFIISLIIYCIYFYIITKEKRLLKNKILNLEKDLIKINKGDYSIDISDNDEYSILRDQMYKIIVNLKSMEEEAKKQKYLLKKDISNIAHQIKTPLTSIGFMVELIQSDQDNINIYLEKLNFELDKLENFTNILLKLSKVNSNTIEYKYIKLSILEIIEDIFLNLNPDLNNIEINYIGEDFKIYGDETWIYEAFLNIIKNSLEHTKDKIQIELISNPIFNMIKISDNGKGLDENQLDRIFDRFYRGNTSLPGYGIGLNLAKSIIEDHNGYIEAFNNNGITFKIKFYNVT